MFVFSAISRVFRIQIWGYKPYVRFPCDFCNRSHINPRLQTLCSLSVRFLLYFAYKSEVTNPMFIFSAVSVTFRIKIWGYKPYVRVSCDLCSTSHINLRLQTLCSCFVRFMQYFAYKSEVTNPMFVFSAISRVFRIQIWSYKPYVRFPWDFCDLSHINPRLQTLCSFSVRFMLYFAYKSEVTNPMFVFRAISAIFQI